MAKVCVIDAETRSACAVDLGAAVYFEHDSTEIICIGYKIDGKPSKIIWLADKTPEQYKLPKELSNFRGHFVAHNWFFECSLFRRFFPKTRLAKPENWLCTQAMSRYFGIATPRSSLGDVAKYLKLSQQKAVVDGRYLIQTYSVPNRNNILRKEIPLNDKKLWQKYCLQDVETEKELYDILAPKFPAREMAVFQADKIQQMRGVPIDINGAKLLVECENKMRQKAEIEAEKLAGRVSSGALVLSSRNEFLSWLRKKGIDLPDAQAGTIANYLKNNEVPADVQRAFDLRKIIMTRASNKAERLLLMTCRDGRYRNPSIYAAAHTKRWQSWGVNFFNFYKFAVPSDKWEEKLIECQVNPTPTLLAALQRGLVCASPKHVLITTDWRNIEFYLSVFYANDTVQLKQIESGVSPYLIFGEKLFGRKISKDADPKEYNLAKIAVLSLGYGAGAEKFRAVVETQSGTTISDMQAQRIVSVWRVYNRAITHAWRACEIAFRSAVLGKPQNFGQIQFISSAKNTVKIVLPSKTVLIYPYCSIDEQGAIAWRPDGSTVEHLYGGKIWENIIQAIAAQILRDALVNAEKSALSVVLHVYDEIVVESLSNRAKIDAAKIAAIMRKPPEWAPDMKLEIEQKISKRWGK